MNDFTKEELEEIIESFLWIESETWWDWKHPLRNKIQSMIDNYCEHDYIGNVNHCVDCGISEYKCNRCGYISYEGLE